ncbi:MAG TPA: glycosyltransferase family 2 protein [Gemmatimonadaceae bacterium]
MEYLAPILWSLPWVIPPAVVIFRARHSLSLDDVSDAPPPDAPRVSIVIPARNESRNIERCVRSVLGAAYPNFEVIVVDDHSSDGTGDIARRIASEDSRLRVIDAPALAQGWFGKQWACATGAREASGTLLLFTDADTRHSPDLLPRAVNAMRLRAAELLSLAGNQEMHSFWERIIQPQMFALLSIRYGSSEHVSNTKRPVDAIANGQFILVRRDSYDAIGGHAAVRDRVAEDMAMAQTFVAAGRRIALFVANDQLSTHMYASLSELIAGWGKNIYAGGRMAALGGALGRASYPLVLLGIPVLGLVPPIVLLGGLLGLVANQWLVWAAIAVIVSILFWAALYRYMGESMVYAFLYPLGFAMLFVIGLRGVVRGRRVEWKQRSYLSS